MTGKPQCFSLNDRITTLDGEKMSIANLKIGQKVLAINNDDQIVPTEIIAILHYEKNQPGKFEIVINRNLFLIF